MNTPEHQNNRALSQFETQAWEGVRDEGFANFLATIDSKLVMHLPGVVNMTATVGGLIDILQPGERDARVRTQVQMKNLREIQSSELYDGKMAGARETRVVVADETSALVGLSYLYARHISPAPRLAEQVIATTAHLWGENPLSRFIAESWENRVLPEMSKSGRKENKSKKSAHILKPDVTVVLQNEVELSKDEIDICMKDMNSEWVKMMLALVRTDSDIAGMNKATRSEADWPALNLPKAIGEKIDYIKFANQRNMQKLTSREFISLVELGNGLEIINSAFASNEKIQHLYNLYYYVKLLVERNPEEYGEVSSQLTS